MNVIKGGIYKERVYKKISQTVISESVPKYTTFTDIRDFNFASIFRFC